MSERWSSEKRLAFELLGPHAVCVVMPDKLVSVSLYEPDGSVYRTFGHNRPSWAVKISFTKSHRDTLSPLYKSHNAWVALRVRARVWCSTMGEAQQLGQSAAQHLARAAEVAGYQGLINGFIDCGPKFNPQTFERHLLDLGQRLGIIAWDERGLSAFLDRALYLAKIKGIEIADRRGRRIMSMAPAFIRLGDRLIAEVRKRQFDLTGFETSGSTVQSRG